LFSGNLDSEFPGPFVSEATFVDGQLHGLWTIKSRMGHNVIEWTFENGVRSGKSSWWYPNGEKRTEVVFKKGLMDSDVLEWSIDGKMTSRVSTLDGKRLVKRVEWYAQGKKNYEGAYLLAQDVAEPFYDWWTCSSKANPLVQVGPDLKHGLWVSWYPNGTKKSEGQFDRDMPAGRFTWFYENGQKQAEGDYRAGVQQGVWTTWHSNGLKQSRYEYRDGNLVGKWMRWDISGKLAEVHDFNVENPQDLHKERASASDRTAPGAGPSTRPDSPPPRLPKST
jgi:antitoxin component YwqK of YwqJK toxin-antitoxin module